MRNPIRLKNLRMRFAPLFVLGALAIFFIQPSRWGFICGLVLVALGGALRSWGAGHLVKNDRLTITGPYAHLRHPLYAGTLLAAVGFCVIAGGWITVGLLVLLVPWFFLSYFPRKEEIESERLIALYGPAYASYRGDVPALIPRLAPWKPSPEAEGLGDPGLGWSGARYSDNNELGTLLALIAGLIAFGLRTFAILQ